MLGWWRIKQKILKLTLSKRSWSIQIFTQICSLLVCCRNTEYQVGAKSIFNWYHKIMYCMCRKKNNPSIVMCWDINSSAVDISYYFSLWDSILGNDCHENEVQKQALTSKDLWLVRQPSEPAMTTIFSNLKEICRDDDNQAPYYGTTANCCTSHSGHCSA
jgi:hypothetical protein